MAQLIETLQSRPPAERYAWLASLTSDERIEVFRTVQAETGTPWAMFQDDPVGFVHLGLNETTWSKQRELMISVRDNKRTAAPASHAVSKTHTAARLVAWWASVWPPGTARIVTTADNFRKVRTVLWPAIRRLNTRHGLPGHVLTVEWQIDGEIVADGFSASDDDEAAVQGIHAPHVLVVVDEGGGVGHTIGNALEGLMTGSHSRLLVIGNPPTDEEDTWFENICSNPLFNVVPIGAYDSPNFTGEETGLCKACPPGVPEHHFTDHLVNQEWVDQLIEQFGPESNMVEARVHARFVRSSANRVIPVAWQEEARFNDNPDPGEVIRLGIDVASDGGDELAVARMDGFHARLVHRSSGPENANAIDVARKLLPFVQEACADRKARGIEAPVRVKVDAIGLGWGIVGFMVEWKEQGLHDAEIIAVNVGQEAGDPEKFVNQRAEMWWNGRQLLQPIPDGEDENGNPKVRQRWFLDVDEATARQLSIPMYKADARGRIQIERKVEMKRRGASSPDRGEALLLCAFEPPGRIVAPMVQPVAVARRPYVPRG